MKQCCLKLLFLSGVLVGLSTVASASGDADIRAQEEIFEIEELNQNSFAKEFMNLHVNVQFDGKTMNFNPFEYLKQNRDNHPILAGQSKTVQSIYLGKRIVNTSIPIDIFDRADFETAAIQAKLFKSVTFDNCSDDRCSARQITALGRAKYTVAYKFLKGNELASVSAPLSEEEASGVKYALVQNAYNWNDFFTTGFNIILIRDVNHQTQLISFQVFSLGEHALPDWAYKAKISSDLNSQVHSFVEVLSKP